MSGGLRVGPAAGGDLGGVGGRAVRHREKRRPESPRPGRLGERAEAAAAQASRWVRVPGWNGSPRCERKSEAPIPNPAPPSGRRAALDAGPRTRASQLFLDLGWQPQPRDARRSAGVGNADQGERASKRQRLGSGVWASASGVFVRTRASRVCGPLWIWVWGRGSACAFVCPWLCVIVLPFCPHFVGPRLVVGVAGRIVVCPLRGLCLSTCLGWESVECVRAETRHRPQLLAPLLFTPTTPRTWLQTFLRVPPATAPILFSAEVWSKGAGIPPLFRLLGSPSPEG